MTVTFTMTETEAQEYLKFRQCVKERRETQEVLELAKRLEQLAEAVYKALAVSEESDDPEIINTMYARAALKCAEKELY